MLEKLHLAIIREVDKEGSLTAAAAVLHTTQSALSHTMRKLEQQLGTEIWLREGRACSKCVRTARLQPIGRFI